MEYENNAINNNAINSEDILGFNLLNIQQIAVLITVYSDIISYSAVLEGKELLNDKFYGNESETKVTPDFTALTSLYIYLIAKILFAKVGFTQYDDVYMRQVNGEFPYSLEPNMDINIGNIFGLIGLLFLIRGAEGIYARDNVQPVFGVR